GALTLLSHSYFSSDGTTQELRPTRDRTEVVPVLGIARHVQAVHEARRSGILHSVAAAKRHWNASYGARVPAHVDGCADSLSPHARRQYALAAWHRPRRYRHADRGRESVAQRGTIASRYGA